MDTEVLNLVLSKYGATHLGYYTALLLKGSCTELQMARQGKLSLQTVKRITKDLHKEGLIEVDGTVVKPPSPKVTKEAEDLFVYFVEKSGVSNTSEKWKNGQLSVAQELVDEHGASAAKWMVDYIVDAKGMNLYSLRLLQSTLKDELIKGYKRHLEMQKLARKRKEEDDGWKDVKPADEPREEIKDLSSIMTFGIEI